MTYFSAAVRLVCFIAGQAEDVLMNVIVFVSEDWQHAFDRALALGGALERSYTNSSGELVEWRLAEVVTLDELGDHLDGREVYSYRSDIRPQDRDPSNFNPVSARPTQSGV